MIGLGLVVVEKFFRRRRRRRRHLGVDPKKLGICIKNIEYRHFSSRGCFLGEKNRRLTEDAGQVKQMWRGRLFVEKHTPEALLKTLARFKKSGAVFFCFCFRGGKAY